MNDAMSLGIHRLWKDRFVRMLDPGRGMRCLDVAGGTGDIAERLLDHGRLRHADRDMRVHVVDINAEMLDEGRRRFRRSMYHGGPQVSFALGNAERLDEVADNSIDLYTIAFGIRNCTHVDRVLTEAHRVLRPGGVFACLEFSRVTNPALAQLYRAYSFGVIPNLGASAARGGADRQGTSSPVIATRTRCAAHARGADVQYLVESIERFPDQQTFADMIARAGFQAPRGGAWEDLSFGIAAIHRGIKPLSS